MVNRLQQVAACTVALTSVVAATSGSDTGEHSMIISSAQVDDGRGSVHLVLRGHLTGLYPGAVKQIRPTLVNDTSFTVTLHSIAGRVSGTSRRTDCQPSRANLRILDYRGPLPVTVHPHRRLDLAGSIPVEMPTGAPPQCSNTQFAIVVSGAGTRSRR
jgi:hypothetical protein